MVFDDAFREVEVGYAVSVVSCGGIVCVRAICAKDDGLSGSQPVLFTTSISIAPAYPKIADAILILLHRAVFECLSGRVL